MGSWMRLGGKVITTKKGVRKRAKERFINAQMGERVGGGDNCLMGGEEIVQSNKSGGRGKGVTGPSQAENFDPLSMGS